MLVMKGIGIFGLIITILAVIPVILEQFDVYIIEASWASWMWYGIIVVGCICMKGALDDFEQNKQ
jgi:hypothetical protein